MVALRGVGLGLLIVTIGVILVQVPYGHDLEESLGLPWLQKLAGKRPAPASVVVVAIDRQTGASIGQAEDPTDWPRSVHAQLVRTLSAACAHVIAFDLFFAPRPGAEDRDADLAFAQAIAAAGNVVLVSHITQPSGQAVAHAAVELVQEPAEQFSSVAAATAPFPLPNVPGPLSGFWAFKTSAGDISTTPTVVAQLYTLQSAGLSGQALQRLFPQQQGLPALIASLRNTFRSGPEAVSRLRMAVLDNSLVRASEQALLWRRLQSLYGGDDWRYFNFYGPAGTVETIAYSEVLKLGANIDCKQEQRFAGKAVLVGAFERSPVEQKDMDVFDTVFTEASGLKLSGVEIAATAIANVLDGDDVKRAGLEKVVVIICCWGLWSSIVWRSLGAVRASVATVSIGAGYFAFVVHQYTRLAYWYPLAIPLVQAVAAIMLAGIMNRFEFDARIRYLRRALRGWLPPAAVEQVVARPDQLKRQDGLVYGVCLHTDLEGYTAFSGQKLPLELAKFMTDYFERIGQPVTRRGGYVSDQTGDAMLAIWASPEPDTQLKRNACRGALEIASVAMPGAPLITRVGIHCGQIVVGSRPLRQTGQYRSFGLIVNLAQRIQSINKVLGTQILVSEEIARELTAEFLYRPVGRFLAAGMIKPMSLWELCRVKAEPCPDTTASDELVWLCTRFAEALGLYQDMNWSGASAAFAEILQRFPEDGPSRLYLNRSESLRCNPPAGPWDAVIRVF